jgi:hypothetical protein
MLCLNTSFDQKSGIFSLSLIGKSWLKFVISFALFFGFCRNLVSFLILTWPTFLYFYLLGNFGLFRFLYIIAKTQPDAYMIQVFLFLNF